MNNQSSSSETIRPLKKSLVSRFIGYLESYLSLAPEQAEEESEVSALCHALLMNAVERNASDIHFDPELVGFVIRLRVDGRLYDVSHVPRQAGMRLLSYLKVLAGIDPMWPNKPVEGWVEYRLMERNINLRVSCVPAVAGEKMTVRLLDPQALRLSVEELGFSPEEYERIQRWLEGTRGMFLVVGAIGSGKTTTLYSLLDQLRKRERSVVTVEDPVEYHLEGTTQMQVNLKRGLNFQVALRTILRIDPDYIMVGEMRDPVSAQAAVNASTSGKIVLSTLHSRDAVGAITSLRNFEVLDYEISAALEFVVSQRLVRKLCLNCREHREPTRKEKDWFETIKLDIPSRIWAARGCEQCHSTGYFGRTGIFEVWELDELANQLILQHTDERTMRRKVRESGVPSILEDGVLKVTQGITTIEEVRSATLFGPPKDEMLGA